MARMILNSDTGEIQSFQKDGRYTKVYFFSGYEVLGKLSKRAVQLLFFLLDNADSFNHVKITQKQTIEMLGLQNLPRQYRELRELEVIHTLRVGCYINPKMFYRFGPVSRRRAVAKWLDIKDDLPFDDLGEER